MSKKAALAFGLGASLLLAAGTANAAGNCSAEIAALQQQLGMDQGANATTDNNANANANAGTEQPAPGADATTGTGSSATTGTDTGNSVQQPSAGSSTDSSSMGGSSTMPSGSVTDTSRGGTLNVDPNARASALASLEQAKLHAQSGDEEACMSEVTSAKQMLGVQ